MAGATGDHLGGSRLAGRCRLAKRVICRAAPEDAGWADVLDPVEETRCIGLAEVEATADGPALLLHVDEPLVVECGSDAPALEGPAWLMDDRV